jgi:hypothetical protein
MMTTHTYTEEDCRFALSVEERKCCVTYSEMSTFKDNRQDYPNEEVLNSLPAMVLHEGPLLN